MGVCYLSFRILGATRGPLMTSLVGPLCLPYLPLVLFSSCCFSFVPSSLSLDTVVGDIWAGQRAKKHRLSPGQWAGPWETPGRHCQVWAVSRWSPLACTEPGSQDFLQNPLESRLDFLAQLSGQLDAAQFCLWLWELNSARFRLWDSCQLQCSCRSIDLIIDQHNVGACIDHC